jgi:hypothetical protein
MILKAKRPEFILPERIEPNTMIRLVIFPDGDPKINKGQITSTVLHVRLDEIMSPDNPDKLGCPIYFALIRNPRTDSIRLYPTPDRDYFAKLRYHPVAREI